MRIESCGGPGCILYDWVRRREEERGKKIKERGERRERGGREGGKRDTRGGIIRGIIEGDDLEYEIKIIFVEKIFVNHKFKIFTRHAFKYFGGNGYLGRDVRRREGRGKREAGRGSGKRGVGSRVLGGREGLLPFLEPVSGKL
jgi:hypothetical protein